jgi:hypothetical protein
MKHFLLSISLVIGLSSSNVFSQEDKGISADSEDGKSPHLVGLAAGTTGGIGIAYTFKPNQFSVQGVVFPNVQEDNAFLQAGLNFKYDIKTYENFDIFLFQNNRVFYTKSTFEDYGYNEFGEYALIGEVINEDLTIAHGGGLGINVEIHDRFGINMMTGYGLYNYSTFTLSIDSGIYFRL